MGKLIVLIIGVILVVAGVMMFSGQNDTLRAYSLYVIIFGVIMFGAVFKGWLEQATGTRF